MLVKYIKDAAGIAAGTVKNLPASLAAAMIDRGVCVEAEGDVLPEIPPVPPEGKENTDAKKRETKEDKKAANKETK